MLSFVNVLVPVEADIALCLVRARQLPASLRGASALSLVADRGLEVAEKREAKLTWTDIVEPLPACECLRHEFSLSLSLVRTPMSLSLQHAYIRGVKGSLLRSLGIVVDHSRQCLAPRSPTKMARR